MPWRNRLDNEVVLPADGNKWDEAYDIAKTAVVNTDFVRAPGSAITDGSASALTAIVTGFALADMATVNIKLHVDIAAAATMNINATGAKPIYTALGKPIEANAKAGAVLSLVYNSANSRYYVTGSTAGSIPSGTTAGTDTALTVTTSGSFSLVDMATLNVKMHVNIGSGAAINVNNTGAKGIYTTSGRAVLSGAAVAGSIVTLVYNATQGRFYAIGLSEITASTVIDTDIRRERWTGDGTTKVFDFVNGSYILGGNRLISVTVGAVPQLINDSYTETSTTSITFSEPPPNGVIIDCLYAMTLFGDGIDFGTW